MSFIPFSDPVAIERWRVAAIGREQRTLDFLERLFPTTQETPVNAPTTPTNPDHIEPTIGRKLWLRVTDKMARHFGFAIHDPAQPLDATIVFAHPRPSASVLALGMLQNILVRVHDHGGTAHNLSVPLRQAGDPEPAGGVWAEWMPFQHGQARKESVTYDDLVRMVNERLTEWTAERAAPPPAPATGNHASVVLYPSIRAAMTELEMHCMPGFNFAVDRVYNILHRAFWSECPMPASALGLRPEGGAIGPEPETAADSNTANSESPEPGATPTAWFATGSIVRLRTGDGPLMMVEPNGGVMWFDKENRPYLMRDNIAIECLELVKAPPPPNVTPEPLPLTFGFDVALQLLREGKRVRRASWESTARVFLDLGNHSDFVYVDDFTPRRTWAISPVHILANDWTRAE